MEYSELYPSPRTLLAARPADSIDLATLDGCASAGLFRGIAQRLGDSGGLGAGMWSTQ